MKRTYPFIEAYKNAPKKSGVYFLWDKSELIRKVKIASIIRRLPVAQWVEEVFKSLTKRQANQKINKK